MLAATSSTSSSPSYAWQTVPSTEVASGSSASVQLSAACALLAVMVESQSSTQSGARTDVELTQKRIEELRQQLADAIQAAKDAADKGGFFSFLGDVFGSDIAQIAGAVAAVAATVATGGAAAPLLMIAVAEALQVAAKYGPELGLPKEVCIGIAIASVAVGFASGVGAAGATGTLASVARDVSTVAKIVQGASTATGGVLSGVSGYYHKDELNHRADATGIQGNTDAADVDIDDAISRLSDAFSAQQRQTSTVSEIIDSNADTNSALCNRI